MAGCVFLQTCSQMSHTGFTFLLGHDQEISDYLHLFRQDKISLECLVLVS